MTWAESWLHQPSLLICESLIVIPLSIYATLNSESDPLFFFFHNGVGKWYSDKQCGLIFLLDSAHQGSRQSTSKYRKQLISVISAKMKIKWDEGISWNGWGRSLKSLSRGLNDEKCLTARKKFCYIVEWEKSSGISFMYSKILLYFLLKILQQRICKEETNFKIYKQNMISLIYSFKWCLSSSILIGKLIFPKE